MEFLKKVERIENYIQKAERIEKVIHVNSDSKWVKVAKLILDKVDFKWNCYETRMYIKSFNIAIYDINIYILTRPSKYTIQNW